MRLRCHIIHDVGSLEVIIIEESAHVLSKPHVRTRRNQQRAWKNHAFTVGQLNAEIVRHLDNMLHVFPTKTKKMCVAPIKPVAHCRKGKALPQLMVDGYHVSMSVDYAS